MTGPHNVLGIELNEYAAELAASRCGLAMQWRLAHGYEFKTNPVLDTLEHRSRVRCWMGHSEAAPKSERASAPGAAQVWVGSRFAQKTRADPKTGPRPIPDHRAPPPDGKLARRRRSIGNPPFLGGSKKRGELGARWVQALDAVYAPAVPGAAD